MLGTEVNPAAITAGSEIATRTRTNSDGTIQIVNSRKVRTVGFCPTQPESVHLDHECYDTRFSTVTTPMP